MMIAYSAATGNASLLVAILFFSDFLI